LITLNSESVTAAAVLLAVISDLRLWLELLSGLARSELVQCSADSCNRGLVGVHDQPGLFANHVGITSGNAAACESCLSVTQSLPQHDAWHTVKARKHWHSEQLLPSATVAATAVYTGWSKVHSTDSCHVVRAVVPHSPCTGPTSVCTRHRFRSCLGTTSALGSVGEQSWWRAWHPSTGLVRHVCHV
jgi:hypothetical protein